MPVYQIKKHVLQFKFTAGTSRGTLNEKETWFVKVFDSSNPEVFGIGECSPLKGLSIDYSENYENLLRSQCERILSGTSTSGVADSLAAISKDLPSIRFGLETALLDLQNGGRRKLFDCDFYDRNIPIPINGLIWMGDKDFMLSQLKDKLASGFDTIKIKVGALDHASEIEILKFIRKHYGKNDIAIRLDANGAYDSGNVLKVLEEFSKFDIHSIEQPVKQGNTELMAEVCSKSSIPVALDEELIGVVDENDQAALLDAIKPQFIILKPSLVGGLSASLNWINLAAKRKIGWWMTSLLESNIGLNAIAQFTSKMKVTIPQGLGTGQLYHNNVASPLEVKNGKLLYDAQLSWDLTGI